MTAKGTKLALALALTGVLGMSGCDDFAQTAAPAGQTSDAGPQAPQPAETPPSQRSADLKRYYSYVETNLLTQGLLRTDGGGPDTPFDADTLVDNFMDIAFSDDYIRNGSQKIRAGGDNSRLSRWNVPVRIGVEFGASVQQDDRELDRARIDRFAARLARLTQHPITTVRSDANFHVFVAGEDDQAFVQSRLKQLIPSISDTNLRIFANLPRSHYCIILAFSGIRAPNNYTEAVALIRAEHPDLVRRTCIHEEIAQGLGLPNDSPTARPSIFNDDDEFALLTSHDELLLKMLYDPRLKAGMTAEEARPVARIIARELMGQTL